MARPHENLVKKVLIELSKKGILAWPTPTGTARSLDGKRVIHYGRTDHSDIIAFVHPTGRALFIEVKIPPDKQSEGQKNFQVIVQRKGCYYIIVTPENFKDVIISCDRFIKQESLRL